MNAPVDIKPACQLRQVPRDMLREALPLVIDRLIAVAERSKGEFSVDGMIDKFASGAWQMWVVWDGSIKALIATELFLANSGMKMCTARIVTGEDSATWLPLIDELEAWARDEGCARFKLTARKGYARKLPAYRMTHVMLEKDL